MKKIFLYLAPVVTLLSASCSSPSEDPKSTGTEYMPDMYRSVAYETYSENAMYADSMSSRLPVSGTVARGNAVFTAEDRLMSDDFMKANYPGTPEGYEAAGMNLKNPLARTDESMAEGKRLYGNYCLMCHGSTGQGDGPVVQNNGPKPPAYNSEQLKTLSEGKMFHSIHYGKNMMGSHASLLTASQRWMIIQYVQTLQNSGTAVAAAPADSTAKDASPKM